jgi:hypothetical protein
VRHAMQVGDKRQGKVVVLLKHLPPPDVVTSPAEPSAPATSESPPGSRETSAPSAA